MVAAPEAGVLMGERSGRGVAEAVIALRGRLPSRESTRRYAEGFSWDDTTAGLLALFSRVLEQPGHGVKGAFRHA